LPRRALHGSVAAVSDNRDDGDGSDGSRRAALAGLVVIAVLVIAGYYLATALRENGRLQDCLASGRTNCAPIDVKAK
jgi:hypothetical protein